MQGPARSRGRPPIGVAQPSSVVTIKRAALYLFSEKGFDATAVREIAATARVDVALISYQFGSKLGLWRAIVAEVGDRMLSELAAASEPITGVDAKSRLYGAMMAFIDQNLQHPEVPKFLLRDATHEPIRAEWAYSHLTAAFLAHFLPLVSEAISAGQFRAPAPELAVLNFGYGVAAMIARREQLVRLSADLRDDERFQAALRETLVEPLFD